MKAKLKQVFCECKRILKLLIDCENHPIVKGSAGDLKSEGDYYLYDDSGIPIVVIKGKDGIIRAFINMCRHQGVRLLEEHNGQIKRNIVYPYHAWSYDTAGCLKEVFNQSHNRKS